ncbi:MAG TPA: hypothetical protein VH987_01195 [Candidatus Limnocylindria bacterium]
MIRRDLVLLTALALVARALAALLTPSPPYVDAAYYTLVAGRLADGHGFTVPVLWSFLEVGGTLPVNPMLPVPSNGHWMPLTSIVAAGPMALLGPSWAAGQIPMVLLSTLLVPLTYLVGWEVWRSRWVAMPAAWLAIFAGPLLVMYPLVENFAVFGVAGAAALYASMRATRAERPAAWLVAAGACVGLATLARIDGLLLAVAPAVAWWQQRGAGRIGFVAGVASAAAALLVLAPWLIRDLAVFGSPLPSAGGHTLWITTYNQQFSLESNPSPASYLASGPVAIIGSKLASWGELLGRTLSVMAGLFGVTFLAGLWLERGRRELRPFIAYWLVMFVVMGLVFTFHAPKGAFMHSAPAWLPFAFPLGVAAVAPLGSALARWWRFLGRPQTHRFLLVVGLASSVLVSVVSSVALLVMWRTDVSRLEAAAAYLRQEAESEDVVMALDPARLNLLTGNPAVAPPFDRYAIVDQVVHGYDVRWVVVTLEPGESRDPLGLWDGTSATDLAGSHPRFMGRLRFEAPGVRVFSVNRGPELRAE